MTSLFGTAPLPLCHPLASFWPNPPSLRRVWTKLPSIHYTPYYILYIGYEFWQLIRICEKGDVLKCLRRKDILKMIQRVRKQRVSAYLWVKKVCGSDGLGFLFNEPMGRDGAVRNWRSKFPLKLVLWYIFELD